MSRIRVLRFAGLAVTGAMFLFGTSIFASATHEVPAPVVGHAAPNFSRMAFNRNQVVLSSSAARSCC